MLAKERNTPRMGTTPVVDVLEPPVAANARIFQGSLVVLAAGYAARGSTALNLRAVGRAQETVDNTGGAAGDRRVRVDRGTFRFNNSGGADEITQADLLADCFIVDDETVAKTNGTNTRSRAGRVMGVDAHGVFVEIL